MTRIFSPYTYSEAPRSGCWWTETCDVSEGATLDADRHCDVAIVGGGFTGLNAALRLAEAGVDVALFEANAFGWGASGRNGGFCCLGGARVESNAAIERSFGAGAHLAWRAAEKAAIDHVEAFVDAQSLDVDRHSHGETWLAHRPKDMAYAHAAVAAYKENYDVDVEVLEKNELAAHGLQAGLHGALNIPIGFGLNPRKYLAGLVSAAKTAGADLYDRMPVGAVERIGQAWALRVGAHRVTADKVLIATNGYSSDTLPDWLAGRYMPAQSSVVVSRPLTDDELATQGWTSRQMSYDSRNLLHYFRLMPDNRMLFGMRGGLGSSPASERRARQRVEHDFYKMFPAWSTVPLTHYWSGLVSLSPSGFPFVGEVPGRTGLYASLCYHGNGVAMGSFCGKMIADHILGSTSDVVSKILSRPPARFPFGRFRRIVMPIAYAGFALRDL